MNEVETKGTIAGLQASFRKFGVERMEVASVAAPSLAEGIAWQVKMWAKGDQFVSQIFVTALDTSMTMAIRNCLRMIRDRPSKGLALLTDRQLKAIMAIGRSLGWRTNDLNNQSQTYFGCEISKLTKADASSLIHALQMEALKKPAGD